MPPLPDIDDRILEGLVNAVPKEYDAVQAEVWDDIPAKADEAEKLDLTPERQKKMSNLRQEFTAFCYTRYSPSFPQRYDVSKGPFRNLPGGIAGREEIYHRIRAYVSYKFFTTKGSNSMVYAEELRDWASASYALHYFELVQHYGWQPSDFSRDPTIGLFERLMRWAKSASERHKLPKSRMLGRWHNLSELVGDEATSSMAQYRIAVADPSAGRRA